MFSFPLILRIILNSFWDHMKQKLIFHQIPLFTKAISHINPLWLRDHESTIKFH